MKRLLFLCAITCLTGSVFSQQIVNIRENVYLHLNSASLLSGESLYYKAYVSSAQSGKPSRLSSLLYVEIIDEAGNPVFQEKIKLDSGSGFSDFFVPTTLNTGNYYLVAYTRWMRNFDDYFVHPILIVNPFKKYTPPDPIEKPTISFQTDKQELIAGVEQKVFYSFKLREDTEQASARIVTGDNEVFQTISWEKGEPYHGSIKFPPGVNKEYKVILETNKEDLHFQELGLEVVRTGWVIETRMVDGSFEMNLRTPGKEEEVRIVLSDKQNTFYNKTVYSNQSIRINSDNLPNRILEVRLYNRDGELLAKTNVWANRELPVRKVAPVSAKTREEVVLPLNLPVGEYSISIRKSDEQIYRRVKNAVEYDQVDANLKQTYFGTTVYEDPSRIELELYRTKAENQVIEFLPEYRGELLTGSLASENEGILDGKAMTFSIPGEYFQIKSYLLDTNGFFRINYIPTFNDNDAYIQVMGHDDELKLQIEDKFMASNLTFLSQPVKLDSVSIAEIVQRSIRNQVENDYYLVQSDSVPPFEDWVSQYDDFQNFYPLDDYNRFPSVEDHFTEYIIGARVSKIGGVPRIIVAPHRLRFPDQRPPLITVDGVPADVSRVLEFNPYKIRSIGIINKRYYLGPIVADGVVDVRTFDGNLAGLNPSAGIRKIRVKGITPRKLYMSLNKDLTNEPRKPDLRDQLLWNPELQITTGGNHQLRFNTSDVEGNFDVVIEGRERSGKPYSERKRLVVSPNETHW